ncbi:MAG: glycosyltransferase family 39 protein [Phycisphaerae bacterium]|nr:glycosyltransferase family 39 protein [Phycisphaerae bacterium]
MDVADQTNQASNAAPVARVPIFERRLLLVIGLALVWRVAMAALMPCMSRDGVNFCEFARNLGENGPAYLSDARAQQHPLFPLLLLGLHGAARATGVPDGPVTWQVCGQIVSVIGGMVVVVVMAVLTRQLWRRLELPFDAVQAGCLAALMAALLPLNVQLSADAMSDQLHLAFYLAGACVLVDMRRPAAAALCGLLAGLAFLTRPEGGAVMPAALIALLALRRELGWQAVVRRAGLVCVAFAVCALPFWLLTGDISPKKSPLKWFRSEAVTAFGIERPVQYAGKVEQDIVQAKLETRELHPAALLPWVLYETLRAGRVVIPLLGVAGLLLIRWRLSHAALAGLSACFLAHLALVTMLQGKWGYLNPRHTLVLVMLLTPFAALTLLQVREWLRMSMRARLWPWVLVVLLLPLAIYALRVPDGFNGYLRDASRWLAAHDGEVAGKTLLGANSHRRVAFYSGCTWMPWFEDPADPGMLRGTMVEQHPDYFAIETGDGFERERHADIRAALFADPLIEPFAELVYEAPASGDGVFYLYRFDWAAE